MKVVINDCLTISLAITISDEIEETSITSAQIGYRSPSGKTGYWDATVNSSNNKRTADYSVPMDMLNELGAWKVWTKIIVTGDQKYSGTASILEVVNPWENL